MAASGCIADTLKVVLNDPLYLLLIPYVAGQAPFRRWVQRTDVYNKNKAACKKVMAGYNLIMSAFSLVCAWVLRLRADADRVPLLAAVGSPAGMLRRFWL